MLTYSEVVSLPVFFDVEVITIVSAGLQGDPFTAEKRWRGMPHSEAIIRDMFKSYGEHKVREGGFIHVKELY